MPRTDLEEDSVTGLVGKTPLIRLRRIAGEFAPVAVYAKAEWYNPSGSVKDRAALGMILAGIRSGQLTPEKTIVDASSGNTGIALAMFGAALGYRVHIFMPSNASEERKKMISAFGAELTLTNPLEGTDGAQRRVRKLATEYAGRFFYPDQYNNEANWKAHFAGTAEEIIQQTEGTVTHFIAGLGTSGTFVGTSRRLKEYRSDIRCISIQPDSPLHGIEGLKHMPTAIVPGIYDPSVADESMEISTEEARSMVQRLAREEGLFVGISSGANVAASLKIARELDEGVVVTILCDDGGRYLSEPVWGIGA
ncbi:MAG TPA: PLP-dependent cysteine synthase family protein [Bacteroidota bacterium]|nr:PLP-dependent cysteine synthase family protein [Bacteroidota bacterium]